jgi:hypothetical protein
METTYTEELESAIQAYAVCISEDDHELRIKCHEELCKILNIDKEDFCPFNGLCLSHVPDYIMAYRMIKSYIEFMPDIEDDLA